MTSLTEKSSTLAQYIRKFRKDKGISRRKLPKELGVTQAEVLSVNQIAQIEVYRGLCGETLT
jgi:predicted transcriptional regulator